MSTRCVRLRAASGRRLTLADRLAKLGCRVVRTSPKLPDLARTTRNYAQLLLALFSVYLSPATLEQVEAAVEALPAADESLAGARLRGLSTSHPDWIRAGRIRGGLRARWQAMFEDVDVVLCPVMPTPAFP